MVPPYEKPASVVGDKTWVTSKLTFVVERVARPCRLPSRLKWSNQSRIWLALTPTTVLSSANERAAPRPTIHDSKGSSMWKAARIVRSVARSQRYVVKVSSVDESVDREAVVTASPASYRLPQRPR